MTRAVPRVLGAVGVAGLAIALYDVLSGGFHFTIAGIRLSSFEAYKPFRIGIVCACAALWLNDREPGARAWWQRLRTWSAPLAAAVAVVFTIIAVRYGIFTAGGSDAWGYVSEASLWASGTLIVPEPLAAVGRALGIVTAPLGYRPARTPGASVPTYSAGYPLMMAVVQKVAGESAVYFVVPICGGAVVVLTYLLGARFAGRRTGALAALLVACSPILLFESLEPMSDVPVTMWFVLAWWLVLDESPAAMAGAGLATAAGILTRPNLAPMAAILLIVAMRRGPRIARGVAYAATIVPGAVAVAAINQYLFGAPFESGYGRLSDLYEWKNVFPNLHTYPVWLVQLHTPLILAALAAPFVAAREPDADGSVADTRMVAWCMIAFSLILLISYLFYGVFENWPYLRFLLPAIPLAFALIANLLVVVLQRFPTAVRSAILIASCIAYGIWCFEKSADLGVFAVASAERRYQAVGTLVGERLPSNAALLTVIQSGSVRLYGHRATLRWDEVPADKLDRTIDALRSSGYAPYILLESWEEPMFRSRFGGASATGTVDWPPAFEYHGPITVRIYDPADRARHLDGEPRLPQIIPRG